MQLGEPRVECGPRLEGRHDGYRGDHRGPSCGDRLKESSFEREPLTCHAIYAH